MTVKEGDRSQPARKKQNPRPAARRPKRLSGRASASYLALAAAFPIRPLASEEDLDEAIRVLDNLLSRRKPLDAQEEGYRDSLSHEIERYEAEAYPMPTVSGAAMLRHLIDAREAMLTEVAKGAGIAVSTISSILSGERPLNVNHIKKLAAYFGVGQGVFLE